MSGYATVPFRTCENCGRSRVCKDTETHGRVCGACDAIASACDYAIANGDSFRSLVVDIYKGVVPHPGRMFEVAGCLVGGALRYAAENPSALRFIADDLADDEPRRIARAAQDTEGPGGDSPLAEDCVVIEQTLEGP